MTVSLILLSGALVTFVAYLAILPVLMDRQSVKTTRDTRKQEDSVQDLRARYQLLLASIHDLDLDYDMGKVSYVVYAEQRKMLIGRSVSALIQLDKAEADLLAADDKIEAAIEALFNKNNRKGDSKSPNKEADNGTARRRKVKSQ